MEEKKRKRKANGVVMPNKKVALTNGNTASNGSAAEKVKVTLLDDIVTRPTLVLASGIKVPSVAFTPFAKTNARKAGGEPHPSTHDLLLHSSRHPRLDFTATSAIDNDQLAHYIAVFDPQINAVQIVQSHYLNLHSTLRSETREVAQNEARRTFAQQKEELGKAFGTRKAQKAIADKTINAINKHDDGSGKRNDVQKAILDTIGETMADDKTAEQTATDEFAAKPIPKPNVAAESVEEVYPFNKLIPASEVRLLPVNDWQEKAASEEKPKFYSQYVASRFDEVYTSENISRQKALRYLALLVDFNDALQGGGRGGKKVPKKDVLAKKLSEWEEHTQLVDLVRRRFSNSDNELPKWNQDLLATHVCAIALFVDGWTTDTTCVKNDLKLDNRAVSQYYQELGCKVTAPTEKERTTYKLNKATAAVTRIAKLKLPLSFPKPRSGRRK